MRSNAVLPVERVFARVGFVKREDLDQPWKIEGIRRSLAMLEPGAQGLSREDAMLVLELLMEEMAKEPF